MIAKLAWKNIWFKPLNTILSVILLTSSVAIITTLVLVEKQFEEKFSNNIDGVITTSHQQLPTAPTTPTTD